MKAKGKQMKKLLRGTMRLAKKARPVVAVVAPVVIDVVADAVPGATAIKLAVKAAKEL